MKILAYSSPARGHLYPLVPILDELAGRGHQIAIRTLSSEVGLLAARGFDAAPIVPAIEAIEHDDYRGRTPMRRLKRGLATLAERGSVEIDDLNGAIAATRPDALLVDTATWGASAAAEAWGGPWAQWFPYPLPLSSPDVPPFGPGFRPAAGPLGRLRDRVIRAITLRALNRATLPPFNSVRAAAGVPPFATVDEMWIVAPLLLYLTAEPFEYPRTDWPASVRSVGPCSWDPPAEPPTWLENADQPIILVSTSSEFQDDARLVRTALQALAEEDVFVIATLPSSELLGPVPPNARVEPFVPHTAILERASCAITHGGAGVTQKALAAGVPVCVVPFGRDQFEVARRAEVAAAGTRLPATRLNSHRLRRAVLRAMTMRAGARRVAHGFAAAGGATAAADAFESLAQPHPGPPGVGAGVTDA